MILTVTLNPSVDMSYNLDDFKIDSVNRAKNVIKTAGGKGLNVARVLKLLGADVNTTGFLGGELGDFIKNHLDKDQIKNDFVFTGKPTRNCIAILSNSNQTEILEKGPSLDEKDKENFLEKYKNLIEDADVISISGSSPDGIENEFVQNLVKLADEKGKKTVLDVSGKLLEDAVFNFEKKPYAIKPNIHEFMTLIKKDEIDYENLAKTIIENTKGIELVMLSDGKNGSYLKYNNQVYRVQIPKVEAVNPVGSGDSTVAGLCYCLDKGLEIQDMAKISNACGISNCLNQKTGYIDNKQVKEFAQKIKVTKIL